MQTVANLLVNGASGVTVGGLGTTVKYFPAVPGASIGVASANTGFLPVPGSNRANGQQLHTIAVGNFQCPAADSSSPAVTIGLYAVMNPSQLSNAMNMPSSPSIVTLATYQVAATVPGIVPVPWSFEAWLNADNASGILQGRYLVVADNVVDENNAAITSQSGVNMSANIPFALAMGITFSQTGSGNTSTMFQFSLEQ